MVDPYETHRYRRGSTSLMSPSALPSSGNSAVEARLPLSQEARTYTGRAEKLPH
jgi:hypothetical protein